MASTPAGNGAARRDKPYTCAPGREVQSSAAARPLTPWTPAIKTTFFMDISFPSCWFVVFLASS
jgi:hypothetical protein